jgi:hypothetical protein
MHKNKEWDKAYTVALSGNIRRTTEWKSVKKKCIALCILTLMCIVMCIYSTMLYMKSGKSW